MNDTVQLKTEQSDIINEINTVVMALGKYPNTDHLQIQLRAVMAKVAGTYVTSITVDQSIKENETTTEPNLRGFDQEVFKQYLEESIPDFIARTELTGKALTKEIIDKQIYAYERAVSQFHSKQVGKVASALAREVLAANLATLQVALVYKDTLMAEHSEVVAKEQPKAEDIASDQKSPVNEEQQDKDASNVAAYIYSSSWWTTNRPLTEQATVLLNAWKRSGADVLDVISRSLGSEGFDQKVVDKLVEIRRLDLQSKCLTKPPRTEPSHQTVAHLGDYKDCLRVGTFALMTNIMRKFENTSLHPFFIGSAVGNARDMVQAFLAGTLRLNTRDFPGIEADVVLIPRELRSMIVLRFLDLFTFPDSHHYTYRRNFAPDVERVIEHFNRDVGDRDYVVGALAQVARAVNTSIFSPRGF